MRELIYKIIDNNGFWALAGAVIGNVIIKWLRNIFLRRRVKKALRNELKRNLNTIVFKKDIIRQIIGNLKQEQILTGKSVHSASNVYNTYLSMLSIYLNKIENDNLHIIYEHLRHNDEFMDEFESRIRFDYDSNRVVNIWLKHEDDFINVFENYEMIESLINDYLKHKPKDIYAGLKKL